MLMVEATTVILLIRELKKTKKQKNKKTKKQKNKKTKKQKNKKTKKQKKKHGGLIVTKRVTVEYISNELVTSNNNNSTVPFHT